ncbi:MAG: hypothetical protein Q7S16_05595 [bacterium]|nr:hypothetical protein [bacterium]
MATRKSQDLIVVIDDSQEFVELCNKELGAVGTPITRGSEEGFERLRELMQVEGSGRVILLLDRNLNRPGSYGPPFSVNMGYVRGKIAPTEVVAISVSSLNATKDGRFTFAGEGLEHRPALTGAKPSIAAIRACMDGRCDCASETFSKEDAPNAWRTTFGFFRHEVLHLACDNNSFIQQKYLAEVEGKDREEREEGIRIGVSRLWENVRKYHLIIIGMVQNKGLAESLIQELVVLLDKHDGLDDPVATPEHEQAVEALLKKLEEC